MTLEFESITPIFSEQPMWGAKTDSFTFIITKDEEGYTASTKPIDSTPFDNQRQDLGGYCAHATLEEAKEACDQFLRLRL